ncbi:MAG: protein kinase, partial [Bacteroidia bacterium]
MKRKFIDEMKIISPIRQKSIIEVYDIVEEDTGTYAVLEPMKGKRMSDVVAKKPLSGEAALYYLWDMLKALDVLHKRGIFHRHILPYHIYLEEWRAVLTEFGAARFFVAQTTRRLTQYLSPGFSPLEEYTDSLSTTITYAADLYGLGATFYYALTQQVPTDAPTRLLKKEKQKLAHLRELRRDIPL